MVFFFGRLSNEWLGTQKYQRPLDLLLNGLTSGQAQWDPALRNQYKSLDIGKRTMKFMMLSVLYYIQPSVRMNLTSFQNILQQVCTSHFALMPRL